MSQITKYTIKVLIWITSVFLFLGFIITSFSSDKIESLVIEKIKNQITTKLEIGEVGFSFYEKFPYASVKINNLLAFEKEGFDNDTLLYSKTIYIELSIFDIILSKIDIKKIVVSEGKINIKYKTENNTNFSIFKTNKKGSNNLEKTRITLLNTQVKYQTKNTNIDWHISQSVIISKDKKFDINAELFSKKLQVNKRDYINNKYLKILSNISVKKDSILIGEESEIRIENLVFNIAGSILNKNNIDLKFIFDNQELGDLILETPVHLSSIYKSFYMSGGFSANGSVNGVISKLENPSLNINYQIEDGDFKLKRNTFNLLDISCKGKISNGGEKNFKTTKIDISTFKAKTKNGSMDGTFIITNLNNYYLTASFQSTCDLSVINSYFKDSPFNNLSGLLNAKTEYKGHISFNKNFKNNFLAANHLSTANFNNVLFRFKKLSRFFDFKIAELQIINNNIKVKNSNLILGDSDFKFTGNISNLILHLINKKKLIAISGELKSTYIKFDELFNINDSVKIKRTIEMPSWIQTNIKTDIKAFSYNGFTASNISSQVEYKNEIITAKNTLLNSLNGEIIANLKFYKSKDSYKLFSQANLKQLNIRNAFLAFDNFKQDFITSQHIKGIGSAEIQMQAAWDQNFNFKKEELKVKSHLIIEKGELLKFKPLESLSNYVSIDDLREVKFSTLENTIEIDNNVITIPNMEIKSSALSVFISGTHTFAKEVDYRIKLLLSELISSKFRKKNTKIKESEFGEIQENSEIFNTIYFKMIGNSDNPTISFDGIRFREDIKKGVRKEKEVITNIIKEDILRTKEKEKIEKGQDIVIEWNDE